MAEKPHARDWGTGNALVDDALLLDKAARRKPLSAAAKGAAKRIFAAAGQAGGFGSGCSEIRHEWWRNCEHYLPVTFSAGRPEEQVRFKLPSGVRPGSDASARFLAHLTALRALCLAGFQKTAVVKANLAALRTIPRLWDEFGGGYTPAILVAGLKCLKLDPSPAAREVYARGMKLLLQARKPLGWTDLPIAYVDELLEPEVGARSKRPAARAPRKGATSRPRSKRRKEKSRRRR